MDNDLLKKEPTKRDKTKNEIFYILSSLNRVSRRLAFSAFGLIMFTSVNLILTLLVLIRRISSQEIYIYGLLLLFLVIFLAFIFDLSRKNGDAIFEELSDSLHGNKDKLPNRNFSLEARIIMRKYSNSVSIPLFPGRYGQTIIIIINILMTFLYIQLR